MEKVPLVLGVAFPAAVGVVWSRSLHLKLAVENGLASQIASAGLGVGEGRAGVRVVEGLVHSIAEVVVEVAVAHLNRGHHRHRAVLPGEEVFREAVAYELTGEAVHAHDHGSSFTIGESAEIGCVEGRIRPTRNISMIAVLHQEHSVVKAGQYPGGAAVPGDVRRYHLPGTGEIAPVIVWRGLGGILHILPLHCLPVDVLVGVPHCFACEEEPSGGNGPAAGLEHSGAEHVAPEIRIHQRVELPLHDLCLDRGIEIGSGDEAAVVYVRHVVGAVDAAVPVVPVHSICVIGCQVP